MRAVRAASAIKGAANTAANAFSLDLLKRSPAAIFWVPLHAVAAGCRLSATIAADIAQKTILTIAITIAAYQTRPQLGRIHARADGALG
jgi:hypothetical protein